MSNAPGFSGLSSDEALQRLKRHGKNLIVDTGRNTRLRELIKIIKNPMGLMLLGLSALYYVLGESTDATVMLLAYIPVTIVDVFLDLRAERALNALKAGIARTCHVIRDGKISEIPLELVVPGDLVVFDEGRVLPADGKVLEAHDLSINEAALTGESIPVEKAANDEFYAGTSLLAGRGVGLIEKTGRDTRFGQIGGLLLETEEQATPLQQKVKNIVSKILWAAGASVILLFVVELLRGKSLIMSLVSSLTFAMAAVPEEFPVVFTLYLSFGAWRLSRHGVLIKSLPGVEALGHVDVICTDKTGTLTEGKFQLAEIIKFGGAQDDEIETTAIMACELQIVDAMEKAIAEYFPTAREKLKDWHLKTDYAFEATGKHMSHIWHSDTGREVIVMKGAVEGVLEHCMISPEERATIEDTVRRHAEKGKRLLGLAAKKGLFTGVRSEDERGLSFLGLMIFSDPVRESAHDAIELCQRAGIEIKMLTGDHPLTAHAVADELELTHAHDALYNGAELAAMSEQEREQAYIRGAVFSRVSPQQKFEMVKALKAREKVVAMTGDGVNDAPALKLADVGVGMGENASEAARATAKMILMKNDFKGLTEAVFEGRKIFDNLRRSFSYLISFHVPVILLSLLPPLAGLGDFFRSIQIVFLQLLVHPVSAFSFENLSTKSDRSDKSLISGRRLFEALLSGMLLSVVCLVTFSFEKSTAGIESGRSFAFAVLLFGNVGFVLLESYPHFTKRTATTVAAILTLPFLASNFEPLAKLMHLNGLSTNQFLVACALGIICSIPSFLLRLRKN